MKKFFLKIFFLKILLILWYPVYADTLINFEDYIKQVKQIHQLEKPISKIKLIEEMKTIQNQVCTIEKESDLYYILSPICLLKKDFSSIDPQDIINTIRPFVRGFEISYDEVNSNFSYEGTQAIFDTYHVKSILPKSMQEKLILIFLQKNNTKIRIPLRILAFDVSKHYTFYVTKKDLTPLKRCTKQNYIVALESFDGVNLVPGESKNLNTHLAYRKGYCKGSGPQNLKFYGGVCGFVTQLFRTSLLIPNVEIVKREAHSVRLVPYYGDYIFGDDAAIYEMSKQFEIKNSTEHTLYFKVLKQNHTTYLVGISPSKATQGVKISKYQNGELQGMITREIYDIARPHFATSVQHFYAKYVKKVYEVQ